ncbi:MAG: hypothetical protein MUE50_14315, partial [Pirellulaceae bacterium]|nr:hypothetical protein [Pirellulaceae bacterium]
MSAIHLAVRSIVVAGMTLLPGVAALLFCATSAMADIPGILGGGNIEGGRDLSRAESKLKALRAADVGMCRLPISPNDYYAKGTPLPERLDRLVLLVHRH